MAYTEVSEVFYMGIQKNGILQVLKDFSFYFFDWSLPYKLIHPYYMQYFSKVLIVRLFAFILVFIRRGGQWVVANYYL